MAQQAIIDSLHKVLAESYALYLKTQNYHWNVEGPEFAALHALFETHYTDLATAIDDIAESIRILGAKVPASFAIFAENAEIGAGDPNLAAREMVSDLASSTEQLLTVLVYAARDAEAAGDDVTAGFIQERTAVHRKNLWMLKAHLVDQK